ncbi:hypothetical protein, partial [Hufsiella arboris]|uniref:hypothetical protein n=1 Tax=Hufsiella arboris TaxID=2695275 RepID=UPI001F3E305B
MKASPPHCRRLASLFCLDTKAAQKIKASNFCTKNPMIRPVAIRAVGVEVTYDCFATLADRLYYET